MTRIHKLVLDVIDAEIIALKHLAVGQGVVAEETVLPLQLDTLYDLRRRLDNALTTHLSKDE